MLKIVGYSKEKTVEIDLTDDEFNAIIEGLVELRSDQAKNETVSVLLKKLKNLFSFGFEE